MSVSEKTGFHLFIFSHHVRMRAGRVAVVHTRRLFNFPVDTLGKLAAKSRLVQIAATHKVVGETTRSWWGLARRKFVDGLSSLAIDG